jgi:hypothetical protein
VNVAYPGPASIVARGLAQQCRGLAWRGPRGIGPVHEGPMATLGQSTLWLHSGARCARTVANVACQTTGDGRSAVGEVSIESFPDPWCTRAARLGALSRIEQRERQREAAHRRRGGGTATVGDGEGHEALGADLHDRDDLRDTPPYEKRDGRGSAQELTQRGHRRWCGNSAAALW